MTPVSRREALQGLVALLPAALVPREQAGTSSPQDSVIGRLQYPGMAGRPRAAVTDFHNDPFVVGVEKRLRCTCGCNLDVYTCRTTDFNCEVSPAMHRQVVALTRENLSAQEIIDRFVAEHGAVVLMAPPKEGFNLAGYFLPGALIVLVGGLMGFVLLRRTGLGRERAPAGSSPGLSDSPSTQETRRLEAELSNLDT